MLDYVGDGEGSISNTVCILNYYCPIGENRRIRNVVSGKLFEDGLTATKLRINVRDRHITNQQYSLIGIQL